MDNQLAVYRHPTLTVLVDDNRGFLDGITLQSSTAWTRKTFQSAISAIEWLLPAYQHSASYPNEAIHVSYDERYDSFEHRDASINLGQIHAMVRNPYRFNLPSVLVIDYSMPVMNGLEFCEAIRHLPCKKILLTNHADEKTVIDAFNRKLVDRYIKKYEPDTMTRLEEEVRQLQREFFAEQTSTLRDLLSRHTHSFLADPAISALAERLSAQHRFVEYYLFPNPSGILFFDAKGKATLMVIETRTGLRTQFEVAEDQEAPQELLDGLREYRLLPFFSDSGGCYVKDVVADDWLSYCLPPQICLGKQEYFWALFDLPSHYLQGPVYSYEEYLKNHANQ